MLADSVCGLCKHMNETQEVSPQTGQIDLKRNGGGERTEEFKCKLLYFPKQQEAKLGR